MPNPAQFNFAPGTVASSAQVNSNVYGLWNQHFTLIQLLNGCTWVPGGAIAAVTTNPARLTASLTSCTSNTGTGATLTLDLAHGDYVDLASAQTIAGGKTFSSIPAWSGALPAAQGGTGCTVQCWVDLVNAQTVGGTKTFSAQLGVMAAPSWDLDVQSAANQGVRITSATSPILHLWSSNAGASIKNYTILTNYLAQGDFFVRQSSARNGDPIAAGVTRLSFSATGDAAISGALAMNGALSGVTTATATTFSGAHAGDGSAVTNLNASNLATGTVALARLPYQRGTLAASMSGACSAQSYCTLSGNTATFSPAFSSAPACVLTNSIYPTAYIVSTSTTTLTVGIFNPNTSSLVAQTNTINWFCT